MKLFLMVFGGLVGAAAVVWSGANTEWVPVRLPAVMVPGSSQAVEYEVRVYGIVGLAFAAGVGSCLWFALGVWVRSARRERRLSRVLEQVEAHMAENRRLPGGPRRASLLPASGDTEEPVLQEFRDLEQEGAVALLSEAQGLPDGYDEPGDDDDLEGCSEPELPLAKESGRG
jgi:hypothetical protein